METLFDTEEVMEH